MVYRTIEKFTSRYYSSPFQIRTTVGRLRKSSQRGRHIRRLLLPLPWRFKPTAPPAGMINIGPSEQTVLERQPGLRQLQCIPLWRTRDTPLCSLYRLFEDLCSRQYIFMGYEGEYWFYRDESRWRLCNVPDPKESDPVVYAILASFVEALVAAFNWKLTLGVRRNARNDLSENRASNFEPETAPAWTASVPPIEKTLDLNTHPHGAPEGDPHPAFLKRNIIAPVTRLYSI